MTLTKLMETNVGHKRFIVLGQDLVNDTDGRNLCVLDCNGCKVVNEPVEGTIVINGRFWDGFNRNNVSADFIYLCGKKKRKKR